tara:strand:- start:67 stop:411 length:345 start_codon:yes stop_codon:yes gene_type:complete
MPKEEWGTKRLCIKCKSKFYDLNMDPLTCPECGASFSLDELLGNKTKLPKDQSPVSKDTERQDDVEELTEDELMLEDDEEPIADDLDETLLEEDDDDTVSLEEITDVSSPEDEN